MNRTYSRRILLLLVSGVTAASNLRAPLHAQPPEVGPAQILSAGLTRIFEVIQPKANGKPQTFTARLKLVQGSGVPTAVQGQTIEVAFQSPDRLKLQTNIEGNEIVIGRDGAQLWVYAPQKHFGLVGSPDVPRFAGDPKSLDKTPLPLFKLPGDVTTEQLVFLPLMFKVQATPDEEIGGIRTKVVQAQPRPQLLTALKLPLEPWQNAQLQVAMRDTDALPVRFGFSNGAGAMVKVEIQNPKLNDAWPDSQWKIPAQPGDKIETVALAHLTRFLSVMLTTANQKIPTLPVATGKRELVAREGRGRLEMWDGTRVLFLHGTPEEMGKQQGVLLKPEIQNLTNRILYGAGVGSSFAKGSWFFGEIESAQARLQPFMDSRYLREMDAMADAAGIERKESRLANFFPELFHCSGFSVYGAATKGGHMYHGRILDYMKGMGLEPSAVVTVYRPDEGNAWVNLGYAGFIGTVTAMNEKGVSIGEMGGGGEGQWDGKPMAHLLREVMERASNLDEAIAILQRGPRTCEYYYVVSDGKTKQAVGIAATPKTFEVIRPGQSHALLPHAVRDALLLSRGDRYEKLVGRVQANYGKLDAPAAIRLMERPVCMESNIQSVLFAPETLDFWVANADSQNIASHTRYTHYNLRELLAESPASANRP